MEIPTAEPIIDNDLMISKLPYLPVSNGEIKTARAAMA
jgi:hypothetical protein